MRSVIRKKLERRRVESAKEQHEREKEVAHLLRRFGTYLRKRREEEDFTFRAFAARAQMAHSNIFVIEQSKKDPHLSELVKLAQGFNETLSEFLKPVLEKAKNTDSTQHQKTSADKTVQSNGKRR